MSKRKNDGQVRVPCGHCRGSGLVLLTGVYRETIERCVELAGQGVTVFVAGRMDKLFDCKPEALSNRFAKLEEYGLLSSERYGVERRFSLVQQ